MNSIGANIYRTSKTFQKAFDIELRQKVGITFSQWKIIHILIITNGITQKEIALKLEV